MARNIRALSPTRRRMVASTITSRKKQQGHAQWPVLLFERGHLVQKKELLLLKISFTPLVLFLLLLK
jgi:hypothetical protein